MSFIMKELKSFHRLEESSSDEKSYLLSIRKETPKEAPSTPVVSSGTSSGGLLGRLKAVFRRGEREDDGPQEVRIVTIHGGGSGFASNRISTTKYNLLTFLPKFLFDQFRRFANLFFLLIILLQQIPGVSPTGRYNTAVPLSSVLIITAIKEVIEDLVRWKADNGINKRIVEVLRPTKDIDEVRWNSVKAGDVLKVNNNSFFPADMILLKSSDPNGRCYVETANLDGETNLKAREVLPAMSGCTDEDICNLQGYVECEGPNKMLYEFTGNLVLHKESGEDKSSVSPDNILLRVAQLRNTEYVYGLVVYTGHDSKIMKNARSVPLKRSNMDHITNIQIVLMVTILLSLSLISAAASLTWNLTEGKHHWYLQLDIHSKAVAAKDFFLSALTFLILYNNLIPISLIVTQELARIMQAYFINMDLNMYDETTDTPARTRNSNLNEELGQVDFIFSDKTGTLTQNIMKFKQCSINRKLYKMYKEEAIDRSVQLITNAIQDNSDKSSPELNFIRVLALCHSVVPEYVKGKLYYRSVSPDEEALVEAARELNVIFKSSQNRTININVLGEEENYVLLNVLEFNSTRKRMSVILRMPDGGIKLLCKGADSIIYDRLIPDDPLRTITQQHLDAYANEGLRTLCVAEADLSEDEYESWNAKYYEASTATQNREAKIEEVAELIEQNLTLLGATAIEDKLQEEVPETIEKLRKAGLKVWVLTGDKLETAVNIGYSSKQLTREMSVIHFTHTTEKEIMDQINSELEEIENSKRDNTPKKVAVVIDGKALSYVLHSDEIAKQFLKLGILSESVICCRTTPSQKAEVVELVKHHKKGVITLAIGDGANDVSMIQAAHIGVGISGREGLQATLASDYAIAQFRFLGYLILVHGAWSYQRMAKLISYSFYKNICLYIIELWYIFQNGYSGQAIFQRWSIGLYNLFFSGLSCFVFAVFDQDLSATTRYETPKLYFKGGRFGYKMFWSWVVLSVMHSLILYYGTYFAMPRGSSLPNGKTTDLLYAGNTIYTATVITVNVLVGIVTGYWSVLTHICIWVDIFGWLIFMIPFSFLWPTFPIASDMFAEAFALYSSPMFYALGLILLPSVTLLPLLLYYSVRYMFFPDEIALAKAKEVSSSRPSSAIFHSLISAMRLKRQNYVVVNDDNLVL